MTLNEDYLQNLTKEELVEFILENKIILEKELNQELIIYIKEEIYDKEVYDYLREYKRVKIEFLLDNHKLSWCLKLLIPAGFMDCKPKYYNEIILTNIELQIIKKNGLLSFVSDKFELPSLLEENYDYKKLKIIKQSKSKNEC